MGKGRIVSLHHPSLFMPHALLSDPHGPSHDLQHVQATIMSEMNLKLEFSVSGQMEYRHMRPPSGLSRGDRQLEVKILQFQKTSQLGFFFPVPDL